MALYFLYLSAESPVRLLEIIQMCYSQPFEVARNDDRPQDPEYNSFGVSGRLTRAPFEDRCRGTNRKQKSLCQFKRVGVRPLADRTSNTRSRNSLSNLLTEQSQLSQSDDSSQYSQCSKTDLLQSKQYSFFGVGNTDCSLTGDLLTNQNLPNLSSFKRIPKTTHILTNQSVKYEDLNQKLNILEGKFNRMKVALQRKKEDRVRFVQGQQQERAVIHEERRLKREQKQREQNIEKEELKAVVTQVAERKDVRYLDHNPYSGQDNKYYISEVLATYKDGHSAASQHIYQSMKTLQMMQTKLKNLYENPPKSLALPRKDCYRDKKTLIFDLDETLVHCTQPNQPCDIRLKINFPNGDSSQAGINIRPYARQLLSSLSPYFELVVFTASHSCYANVVIDHLDPQRQHIAHRLYRQHCTLAGDGLYIKDLRILNRAPREIVLIDNAAYSFCLQPDNGIPIIPYYSGSHDYQLRALQHYLFQLLQINDVRDFNRSFFSLFRYAEFSDPQQLVETLYQ